MKPTDFSIHVTSFLTHHLAAQRNLSPNTIKAYRDVFTLFLRFCRDVRGIPPEKLRLEQIDVSLVEAFLDHLETKRKSSRFLYAGTCLLWSAIYPRRVRGQIPHLHVLGHALPKRCNRKLL
jgi:hypothetical protein